MAHLKIYLKLLNLLCRAYSHTFIISSLFFFSLYYIFTSSLFSFAFFFFSFFCVWRLVSRWDNSTSVNSTFYTVRKNSHLTRHGYLDFVKWVLQQFTFYPDFTGIILKYIYMHFVFKLFFFPPLNDEIYKYINILWLFFNPRFKTYIIYFSGCYANWRIKF